MNIRTKAVAAAVCSLFASAVLAVSYTTDLSKAIQTGTGSETEKKGVTYNTSGCTPGTWTSDFAAAKAYADTYKVPMLAFWGSAKCGWCARMKTQGLLSTAFTSWVSGHPIVLSFTEVPGDQTGVNTDAKNFARDTNTSGLFPYMRIYWPKKDGTTVSVCFTGRAGYIPQGTGSTVGAHLVSALNYYIGSWDKTLPTDEPDYAGGYFTVTNTIYARLEAIAATTKKVDIPLWRTTTGVWTNKLVVGSASAVNVVWGSSETSKTYTHTLTTAQLAQKADTTIALKLYDYDGTTLVSSSAINIVSEPASSTSNPKWVGEDFDYGEWTMDYDTAKENDGYVLAQFGGSLWCPDCYGADNSLFAEDSDFYDWAVENNVSLVMFDQGNGDGKTAAGTGGARLLTYTEGTCYYISGYPKISGASYLSRKNISASAAASRIAQTTKYTAAWKNPDSTAPRMANPEIVIVRDDAVVARLNAYEDSSKNFDVTENLCRLSALLELADSDDAGDTDDYFATATQTLAVEDDADGWLQINNPKKFYKLTNVPAGKVTFTATAVTSLAKSVKPVITVYDGSLTNVLGSASGSLSVTFANGSNKYLSVAYYTDATTTKYGLDTSLYYYLGSTVTLVPSSTSASFTTTSGTMKMTVTSGTKYKLGNFSSSSYSNFTANSDGSYTANKSGDITMTASAGATVTYQIWVTGTVQFATTSASVMETAGSGTVSVTRTGGSSGAASATVSVNSGTLGTKRVTVSPTTLTWSSGDSSAKTVTYTIAADDTVNSDETFTIALAAGASSSATIGSAGMFTLKVSDSNAPALPSTSYSLSLYKKFAVSQSYAVSNIKEDGTVTVNRTGKLPTGLKLAYNKSSKTLVLSGTPSKAGTFTFTVSLTEKRSSGKSTGAETTFTVTVADATSIASGKSGYNALLTSGQITYGSLPVFGTLDGNTVMAGSLTLKITKLLRLTATYNGADGTKVLFTGNFSSLSSSGEAVAKLTKGNATAVLKFSSAGRAYATLTGMSGSYGSSLSSESSGVNLKASKSAYAGYYTVSIPVDEEASSLVAAGETIATGTGYLILKMNKSAFSKTGKVSYSGSLANGQTFTGSAYLAADQLTADGYTWATLPIVVNRKGNNVGMLVRVRKNAASTYESNPMVVLASSSATPFWTTSSRTLLLNVYGSYYDNSADIEACCEDYYEKTSFSSVVDATWFATSSKYGTVTDVPSATVMVSEAGKITVNNANSYKLALKLAKKTGIVTGTAQVKFSKGATVRTTVRGVLLLGWTDCGCNEEVAITVRPVFSGAAFYTDGSTKRGFALELE